MRPTIKHMALSLGLLPGIALASFSDQLFDPVDGRFDASGYLIENAAGFLPVPIIITEPATGAGGGAALLFFHTSEDVLESSDSEGVISLPPSVSGVIAAGTTNQTWVGGLFHSGSYRRDHIRYLGALAKASINLDYYGLGFPISFNSKADVLFQSLKFRIPKSDWFIGADYEFVKVNTGFRGGDGAGIPESDLDIQLGGLGFLAEYDSRNNTFTPTLGTSFEFKWSINDPSLGSSYHYKRSRLRFRQYFEPADTWDIAYRVDGEMLNGEAPFFADPFLNMRGIPVMRYQGERTLLTEVEVTKALDSRWYVLGFAGLGRAWNEGDNFDAGPFHFTRGVGGRYLIARQFGLRAGIDLAWGPEDTAIYLTVGSAFSSGF